MFMHPLMLIATVSHPLLPYGLTQKVRQYKAASYCVLVIRQGKIVSVGEQSTKNGSDPLLVAIENYWRQNTRRQLW